MKALQGVRILELGQLLAGPFASSLLASYGDAGTSTTPTYWLALAAFACVFIVGTWAVLVRTTRRAPR